MSTVAAFLRLPSAMRWAELWNRAVTWSSLVPTNRFGKLGRPGATQGTSGHRMDVTSRHMGTTVTALAVRFEWQPRDSPLCYTGCAEAYDPLDRLLVRQATRRRTPNARLRCRPPF